jgi:hypothetical protein
MNAIRRGRDQPARSVDGNADSRLHAFKTCDADPSFSGTGGVFSVFDYSVIG